MRQDLGSKKRSALWRRRLLAAGVVGVFHLALFGVIVRDWALHRAPARIDAVEITLERPMREQPKEVQRAAAERPPPPPPPPVLAPAPQRVSPNVRSTPAPGEPAVPPLIAERGGPTTEERAGGALNLGCLTSNLPKRQREECDRKTTIAYMEQPTSKRKTYEPPLPRAQAEATKSAEPGVYWSLFPPGFKVKFSPNDKGFPPGMGDTKTTVFEPAEIHDLPTPMK